jgi:hypothetical protein
MNPYQNTRRLKVEGRVYRAQETNADMVKVVINNVILAIKVNTSMLSVQNIHGHLAKYRTIPESWHHKNYAYDFVECINSVIEKQLLDELRKSRFHTLIVDESTAFYCSQYL